MRDRMRDSMRSPTGSRLVVDCLFDPGFAA
jgi:hypothetical protein